MTLDRETLVDLNHQLAGFLLPGVRSNSDARLGFVKQVAEALADFRLELKDFSTPSFPKSLLEAKRAPVSGTEISGYGSVFGVLDLDGEVVDSGAFAASLDEYRRTGTKLQMLWQHNPNEVIGIWEKFSEDQKGLLLQGRILPTVQRGAEAIALIDAGAICALSIAFKTVRAKMIGNVRHLQQLKLYEVSLATFPSNVDAKILTGSAQ